MDIQDIQPGQDFAQSIEDTIAHCECILAVIGPRWLETVQERAHGGEDFVRDEVGAALKRGIRVIPVLVGGARMPPTRDLPPQLSALGHRNAVEIRDDRFEDDVARLGEFLSASTGLSESQKSGESAGTPHARPPAGHTEQSRPRARPGPIIGAVVGLLLIAAAVGAYFAFRPAPPTIDGAWVAQMQKPGRRPYRVRLEFFTTGNNITGTVQYPAGDGSIEDGHLDGRILTFSTVHTPQFASEPATTRYQAEVTDDTIKLTSTDPAGVATGVARRTPAEPRRRGGGGRADAPAQ